MSRNGTLLPIPADSGLSAQLKWLTELWPSWAAMGVLRSVWLKQAEGYLREHYPFASSADLRLTARAIAPFPLRDGHNVP